MEVTETMFLEVFFWLRMAGEFLGMALGFFLGFFSLAKSPLAKLAMSLFIFMLSQ